MTYKIILKIFLFIASSDISKIPSVKFFSNSVDSVKLFYSKKEPYNYILFEKKENS